MFELIKNVNIDFLGKRKIAGMISGDYSGGPIESGSPWGSTL